MFGGKHDFPTCSIKGMANSCRLVRTTVIQNEQNFACCEEFLLEEGYNRMVNERNLEGFQLKLSPHETTTGMFHALLWTVIKSRVLVLRRYGRIIVFGSS
jgi:hypothetical protein